jgi:hypothetical protein
MNIFCGKQVACPTNSLRISTCNASYLLAIYRNDSAHPIFFEYTLQNIKAQNINSLLIPSLSFPYHKFYLYSFIFERKLPLF